MRQQIAALCAWSAVLLMLAATNVAPLRAEDAAKPAAKVELSREERIEQALDRPCEIQIDKKPILEALDELSEHYKIAIVFDRQALASDDEPLDIELISGRRPPDELRGGDLVSIRKGVSLGSQLRNALYARQPRPLGYLIRHDAITITTFHHLDDDLEVRVYPVADLINLSQPVVQEHEDEYEHLIETISDILHPTTWVKVGGEGEALSFGPAGALVVRQTPNVHADIEWWLEYVRDIRAKRDSHPSLARKDPNRLRSATRRNTRNTATNPLNDEFLEKLTRALVTEAAFDFPRHSFDQALEEVGKKIGIPICIDAKSLAEQGNDSEELIKWTSRYTSVRGALDALLRDFSLTWVPQDNVILVMTEQTAETRQYIRNYDIRELTNTAEAPNHCCHAAPSEVLRNVVTSLVQPATWIDVAGTGTIHIVEPGDILSVSQSYSAQEQMGELLAMLRDVKARQFPEGKLEPVPEKAGDGLVLRVYEVSAKPKMVGVGGGFFNFDDKQPASSAAKPPENAKCEAPAAPTVNPDHVLAEQLVKAIPELIEPKTWQAGGGPGKIFAVGPRLLVRQTCEVHAQIKDLLKAIGQ